MSQTDTAQLMGVILASSGAGGAADNLAESIANATQLAVAGAEDIPLPFDDAADCWRFAIAFLASSLALPIPNLLAMTLDEFLRWHKQAVRLRIGQHQTAAALIGAIASQTALQTTSVSK